MPAVVASYPSLIRLNRYYQTWLESSSGFDNGPVATNDIRQHADGSTLRPSNDKALLAFAQLGCRRLNAKRAIVTLISSDRQYILAEATKSLSLRTGLPEDDENDELWFGNASLPRERGISAAALDPPHYATDDATGPQHTGAALVIRDITLDDRFRTHALAGRGVSFYAGVPIMSKAGHAIGVYNITDDKPRHGLSRSEFVFMQDMADTAMQHLQVIYNNVARYRGEQLVAGLGRFLEGETSMRAPTPSKSFSGQQNRSDQNAPSRQVAQDEDAADMLSTMSITNANPNTLRQVRASLQQALPSSSRDNSVPDTQSISPPQRSNIDSSLTPGSPGMASPKAATLEELYGRAANILRDCATADGVIFYDASALSSTKPPASPADIAIKVRASDDQRGWSGASTDSEGSDTDRKLASGRVCDVLGYALDTSPASTAYNATSGSLALTARNLRHFVKRYPRGHVFYFTEKGEIAASDGEVSTGDGGRPASSKQRSRKALASSLIQAMPGARNVIWLPLWNFAKQRWCAGTFLWSRRPERLLAAQDDLTYLKTFGNCITMDVARLDAQTADGMKSTFIASISHELRSPLHGILGSTEFLQETALDGFQSSMTHAVETCARTLLDTIEHVLDYSKINQMTNKLGSGRVRTPSTSVHETGTPQRIDREESLDSDVDLAGLFEEAVEAVYAGQTFQSPTGRRRDGSMSGLDSPSSGSRETIRSDIVTGSDKFFDAVRLTVEVERSDSWWVRTQPGAIRRIVMNIFGNALKYTERGTIIVSLTESRDRVNKPTDKAFCISVKDTGRGMSADYLRNHAFTAFSQESYLSSGSGLGLSIVRQIVNSLGGHIQLESTKGMGTEIKIFLTVPAIQTAPPPGSLQDIVEAVRSQTSGKSLCVLDPNAGKEVSQAARDGDSVVEASVRALAEKWFDMSTSHATSMEGQSPDFFVFAEPPPIEYLLRHHGNTATSKEVPLIIMATNAFESASLAANGINQLTDLGRVLEVISQPCGPYKMAKALHRCLARIRSLRQSPDSAVVGQPLEPEVSDGVKSILEAENDVPHATHQPGAASSLGHSRHQSQRMPTKLPPKTATASPDRPPGWQKGASPQRRQPDKTSPQLSTSLPSTEAIQSVLLVDDNDINLRLLVAMMKKAKFDYTTAKDGLQAVRAYENALSSTSQSSSRRGFDCIIMDISMPVMDGIEATRQIRQREKAKETTEEVEGESRAVIVALTGLGAASTRQEMEDAGADFYVTKPVRFGELMGLLNGRL